MPAQINAQSVAAAFSARRKPFVEPVKASAVVLQFPVRYPPGSWAEYATKYPSPYQGDGSSASGRL